MMNRGAKILHLKLRNLSKRENVSARRWAAVHGIAHQQLSFLRLGRRIPTLAQAVMLEQEFGIKPKLWLEAA